MIIKLFFHAFPLYFVRWTVIFYGNLPKTLFFRHFHKKIPQQFFSAGVHKAGLQGFEP